MIEQILRESESYPHLFHWNGPLKLAAVEDWERQHAIQAPADLKLLWTVRGGGDMFESETILQPFGAPEYDLVLPVSEVWWGRGLSRDYVVFRTGIDLSVFRKSDGALFNCLSERFGDIVHVQDLGYLYETEIRPLFAEKYGLSG